MKNKASIEQIYLEIINVFENGLSVDYYDKKISLNLDHFWVDFLTKEIQNIVITYTDGLYIDMNQTLILKPSSAAHSIGKQNKFFLDKKSKSFIKSKAMENNLMLQFLVAIIL